ncbi:MULTISPECIES: hypothetical protein [unclassified Streptomyces]|nr:MULTISPECIES: hypothetical protein [unclassified Streptomyces]
MKRILTAVALTAFAAAGAAGAAGAPAPPLANAAVERLLPGRR